MPEYAVGAVVSIGVVVALERLWLRTGVFRNRAYWIAMGICLSFMVLTNGWLTKLSAPVVIYDAAMKTPWRFPWDIPVEDYLFGFTLLTLVIVLWERAGTAGRAGTARTASTVGTVGTVGTNRSPESRR